MSGYPYGNGNPQYPPPQNHIYPQLPIPANAPVPGQGAPSYPNPSQNTPYGFQPAVYSYPQAGMPQPNQQPMHGQQQMYNPPYMGGSPQSINQSVIAPTAPLSPPAYGHPGYPTPNGQPAVTQTVQWIPTTSQNARSLSNSAIVAGYEGWDGSPLWVIRARYRQDLVPGKLAIKHQSAYIPWGGEEIAVKEFEVCCASPDRVRWVQCGNGVIVPPNAVVAGNTSTGEPLYVGRAKQEKSLTPGKVHPSHKALYISYAGKELPHKVYEVLCTV